MKMAMLSVLRTDRLYSPENIPGNAMLLEAESTPGPQFSRKGHVNETFHRTSNITFRAVIP